MTGEKGRETTVTAKIPTVKYRRIKEVLSGNGCLSLSDR
jgi:hypothetical protein